MPARGSRSWKRRTAWAMLVVAVGGTSVVVGSRWYLHDSADGHVFGRAASLPHAPVALVLGAGVRPDGAPSLALRQRVNAAVELLDNGTVDHLLMSGDNGRASYDEPTVMRRAALADGARATSVTLDFAGFDTWSSCRRAHEVFGVSDAVIVTHQFHIERAVALCRAAGIDADGYAVPDDLGERTNRNVRLREWPAAVKATLDILTDSDPKYLGPREPLNGSLHPANGE